LNIDRYFKKLYEMSTYKPLNKHLQQLESHEIE
jgi:hypothetical protein